MELRTILSSVPTSAWIIGTIIFIHWTIKRQMKRKQRKLPVLSIPGPKPLPFLGNSLDLIGSYDILNDITQFSKAYGSPYKLWIGTQPYVVLSTAEHLEIFFRHSKANHKTDLFNKFKDVFGNSVFTSVGPTHLADRKNHLNPCPFYDKNVILRSIENEFNGLSFKNYSTKMDFDIINNSKSYKVYNPLKKIKLVAAKIQKIILSRINFRTMTEGIMKNILSDVWKTKRKNLLQTMNGKRLDNFEPIFQHEVKQLIADLENKQNETIDLWNFLPYLAFNIVTKTNVDSSVTVSVTREEFKFHELMKEMFVTNFKRVLNPTCYNKVVTNCVYGLSNRRIKRELKDFIKQIIPNKGELENESQSTAENEDFRNYAEKAYILSKMTGNEDDFYDDVLLSLSAGTINVSVVLGFFLLMMGIHPHIQNKVYNELKDNIDSDTEDIGSSHLQKLPYFDQVFKETLRRFTLVPLIFRKLETNIEIDGITLPKNTNIIVSLADVHFSTKYWKDPLNFDPENFDSESVKVRPKYAYLPFAAGPRDCLGKMYAVLAMKIILVSLIREYKFTSTMKMADIKLNYSFLISSLNGYNVKIEARNNRQTQ